MSAAPLPINEEERLSALDEYHILDTSPEKDYDNIVKLVTAICGTPIALVSLVDKERQWFKAKLGIDAPETHRDLAFCSHAILEPTEPFIVGDAHKDPRFADNELVTGPPNIRFYAGCPLVSHQGLSLGTLCTIDIIPRKLTPDQIEALKVLATNVVTLMELRKTLHEREELNKKLISSNQELEHFAHMAAHDLKAPLRAISIRSAWLEEEIEKNLSNEAQIHIRSIQSRLNRMQKLIDDLLNYTRANNHYISENTLNAAQLLDDIINLQHINDDTVIDVDEKLREINLPELPSFHVFQNLISNALKHHDKAKKRISITVSQEHNSYMFYVKDDGPGIPQEHQEKIFDAFVRLQSQDKVEGSGLGLAMIKKLLEKIKGTISIQSSPNAGATFIVTVPLASLAPQTRKAS